MRRVKNLLLGLVLSASGELLLKGPSGQIRSWVLSMEQAIGWYLVQIIIIRYIFKNLYFYLQFLIKGFQSFKPNNS
jgi:hypothetical protein